MRLENSRERTSIYEEWQWKRGRDSEKRVRERDKDYSRVINNRITICSSEWKTKKGRKNEGDRDRRDFEEKLTRK